MTLLHQALSNLIPKAQTERVPTGPASMMAGPLFSGGGIMGEANREQQLGLMASSSWLFAVIDRIATSVAAVEWRLVLTRRDGTEEEIWEHPALDLWARPGPYTTRSELLEAATQYFELLGEIPLLIVSPPGEGLQLQLLRPTRIFPVPSKNGGLEGYIYQVGATRIPLAVEDVIFIRRPNPLNEYRGLGVVQSLLIDLGAERAAAAYVRNFFRNDASPGGVVEVDGTLDDATFLRLRDQWAEGHQGVANAHRVAILEKGHWKDRAFSHREIQFNELRKLGRDLILGAFGMPMSALGITESVNRANAEAGEVLFSRWIIRPRLARIAGEITEGLLPLFPGTDRMRFDFIDPTPADRVQDALEGTSGYIAGVLTLNEARAHFGEAAVQGGDDFKAPATNDQLALEAWRPKKALTTSKHDGPEGLTRRDIERRWHLRM